MRKALVGLVVAVVLGVAAAVAHHVLDHRLREILAQGQPARATVTAVADTRSAQWSEVRYEVGGRTYSAKLRAVWYPPLEVGDRLTVYTAPTDHALVATEDGYSSLSGTWLPMTLALLAGIVLVSGVAIGLTDASVRRWANVGLDDLRPPAPRIRHGRGVVRRNDLIARVMTGIVGVGAVATAVSGSVTTAAAIVAVSGTLGSLLIASYLIGFASKVVVTPGHLIVCTAFTAHHVPRSLATGVGLGWDGVLELMVRDHPTVLIRTGASPIWWRGGQPSQGVCRGPQLTAASRLRALTEAIPADGRSGPVIVTRRYGMIALAATGVVSVAVAVAVIQLGAVG